MASTADGSDARTFLFVTDKGTAASQKNQATKQSNNQTIKQSNNQISWLSDKRLWKMDTAVTNT
jgi:hypothetical protein